MQNQEKIIQAIAAYLGKVMTYNNSLTKIQFERTCVNGAAEFIEQEATYIAAAIAPHLEAGAGWEDAPEWSEFKTTTNSGDIIYWEHQPVCSPLGFWIAGNHSSRYEVREIKKGHLEQRPR